MIEDQRHKEFWNNHKTCGELSCEECNDRFEKLHLDLWKLVAENWREKAVAHQELLQIHQIGMCIAECSPIEPNDSATVRMVKEMAYRLNKVNEEGNK